MNASSIDTTRLPIDLGDGLVLRCATERDALPLSEFNAHIHNDEGPDKPDERIRAWTLDLMARPHPTFRAEYCTIVEDSATGKIVSSMNLIPQTWTYGGVPFKVGRPELVGTLPEYRNRGLVRVQFDVIHRWSVEQGQKVQAITGIPYYYRQFGYEMALNLTGGRIGYLTHIPRMPEGEQEPYRIRPAGEEDIPLLSRLAAICNSRFLVACEWDEALWRYELSGKSEKNVNRAEVRIIETGAGEPCGFLFHPHIAWTEMMVLQWYEILPGYSWQAVTPSVIRYLEAAYAQYPSGRGEKKPLGAFGFWLGEDHPVYHALSHLLPRARKPYAWYLRLVDVPDFLRLVQPVLENHLAGSPMAGFSGEFRITFYRAGLRLVISKGKFEIIEAWKPTPVGHAGEVAFPPHTFLQLLFGYRSMDMLMHSFADVWVDRPELQAVLDAIFPRQPSDLWPVS